MADTSRGGVLPLFSSETINRKKKKNAGGTSNLLNFGNVAVGAFRFFANYISVKDEVIGGNACPPRLFPSAFTYACSLIPFPTSMCLHVNGGRSPGGLPRRIQGGV